MKATADLTETISMASQIGSRGPQQAAAGILQLTQAMALGRLSGQNLNSVLQSTPRISIAIAQGLGVTTSALRGLAEGKKLTADVITRALQGQARVIAEEFLRLKPTISSAFTVLNNAAIEFMGNLERSTGFASGLASVVILLSRNMDVLAMIVTAVGSALMVAFGGAVRRAIVATSLAIAANPIGAVIALVTSLVAAVIFLGDRFSVTSDGMVSALDYIKGAFSLLWDVVANFGETMSAIWAAVGPEVQGVATTIWEWISWAFMGILSIAKTVINAVIGLFVFTYNAVVITWNKLPAAIQNAFALAINWVAEKFEGLINSLIGGINALSSYFGMGQIGEVSIGRMADTGAMADYYGSLGRAAGNAFGTDYVGAVGDALGTVNGMVMDRARGFSQRRRAGGSELSDVPGVATPYSSEGAGSGGSGSNGRGSRRLSRAEMIQEEMTRIHDETVTAANTTYTYLDRAAYEALDKFNSGLRSRKDQSGNPFGVLNPQEEQAMLQAILGLDRAKRIQEARDDVMRQAIGPRLKYIETEEAIGQLLRSNTISAGEAERAYLDAAIEFYQTREDRVSGQMLGRLQIMKEMRNQAQPLANAMKSIWEEQTGPMREYQTALEAIAALERDRMLTAQQAADATRNATIDYLDTQTDAASGVTRALMKIQQEAANVAQQMETLFSNAFSNLEDTWVEFTKTGKFDLSSFFDGLQEDIARATFKQYISGPLAGFLEDKLGIKVPGLAGPVGESRNNPMWVRSADQVGGTAAFNALFVDTSKREANKGATNDPFGIGGAVDDMNGCFGTFTDDLGNTLDTGAQSFGNELGGIIGGLGSMLGGLIGGEAGGIISTIAQGASMILPALGIGFATGGSFTVRDRDDYGDFATGGGFTVGGGGGVDSQLVSFRASPGERVNIERAGQVGDKSGGGGVSVAFSIDARGADASVEQRIRAAIAEATPQIVTAARQGSAQDRRYEMSRMPVGSRKN
jgi:lambda family phage tail tape measure protein